MPEGPDRPAFQVCQVVVVGEGFPLETNATVSPVMVAVLKPTDNVFEHIPDVKQKNP